MTHAARPTRSLAHDPADWLPASVITGGVVLAMVPFVISLPLPVLVALWLTSIAARSIAPIHHHFHAHYKIFRGVTANAVYDFVLMLAAGHITAVWELQHVHGHHRRYLTPEADPADIGRFGHAGRWQRAIYTLLGDAASFTDSLAIARAARARWLPRLWRQQLVQIAVMIALVVANPLLAVVFVIVPNVLLRWTVFWVAYAHHHEVPLTDVYSGSVTSLGWANRFYLNVGHHTAHHEKPTLHWSRLPARTAQIMTRIPSACLR